ncbi:MAG: glutamate 5-kinase [Candidatus Methanomethylophilaceae archaeon]
MKSRKEALGTVERVVIKVGTSSITRSSPEKSAEFMEEIADQVKTIKDRGIEVLIVSSGAIGLGIRTLGIEPHPSDVPMRQAAASIGQSALMHGWNTAFEKRGLIGAQILLTMDSYSVRETANNLGNTVETLLSLGAVPVFNENDAVCTKEIDAVFGDNDTLSAVIASNTDSDLLIILSDVDGLYTKNPKLYEDAELVSCVSDIDEVEHMAGDPTTNLGVGGMKTKLSAARICADAGCNMVIASGFLGNSIVDVVNGEDIGTLFVPGPAIPKKRRWLKSVEPHGKIYVDDGAAKALKRHHSLLPVGITEISGGFSQGDPVDVMHGDENIARGISNYDSDDLITIMGKRKPEADRILGRDRPIDVIHTENMVLL